MKLTRYKGNIKHANKKHKKIPGTIEIKYKDENGNPIFEWKRNRSGNNVEYGIYEMLRFFKEKMSIDIVNCLENFKQNINIQMDTTDKYSDKYSEKDGDVKDGNNTK